MDPVQVNQGESHSFHDVNKENVPQALNRQLKRKFSEPTIQSENQISLNKKTKREPLTLLENNEIEIAKFLTEIQSFKHNVTLNQLESLEAEVPLKMTCESDDDLSSISPIKSLEQLPELAPLTDLTNQQRDDIFISSTPTKTLNYLNSTHDNSDDLFTICRNENIKIISQKDLNRPNLNETYIVNDLNEIDQLICQAEDVEQIKCYYTDSDQDDKPKTHLKVKMNFCKMQTDSSVLSESKVKKQRMPEQPEVKFCLDFILEHFNEEEIRLGIFSDKLNKSRSKTRVPLTSERTDLVKQALGERFQLIGVRLDNVWTSIRSKVNVKLHTLPKTKRFQKRFEIKTVEQKVLETISI